MVRVRFAPSPTGDIHIGNVRAALFNYIFAKKNNGKFILRIEDTDLERSSKESLKRILEDLKWLGLNYDEGPDIDGPYGPYVQSERLHIYKKYAQQLEKEGLAYKCYCNSLGSPFEEDDDSPQEPEKHDHKTADAHDEDSKKAVCNCLQFDDDELALFENDKIPYALRYKANNKKVAYDDLVFGKLEKNVEDFIIMKDNGFPTYHFGVVVDDSLMQITHVIRGQDHLNNTFKHILLYRALGFTPPKFAHFSLTYGLSKREKSQSIRFLKESGYLPEAVLNICMLLGWYPKDGVEIFNVIDKAGEFEPADFSKVNSHFDKDKFNHIAGVYIRNADHEKITNMAVPFLAEKGYINANSYDRNKISDIVSAVKTNLTHVGEIVNFVDFFFNNNFHISDEAKAILEQENSKTVLNAFIQKLEEIDVINKDNFGSILKDIQKETKIKGKDLYMPVRISLTGQLHGPELNLITPILGKQECINRVKKLI